MSRASCFSTSRLRRRSVGAPRVLAGHQPIGRSRRGDSGTTHYLEEAEQCNRIGFMVAGELVAEGTPSGIKGAQPGHLLEFIVDQPQRAADLLKKDMAGWRVSLFGERLHVVTDEDAGAGQKRIATKLAADGN